MSPTQRSLAYLRKLGYHAQVVEKYNPFARVRQDLFGIIDIVAVHPEEKGVLGVQTTTSSHLSSRIGKAHKNKILPIWLLAENRMDFHGWKKSAKTGRWEVTIKPF